MRVPSSKIHNHYANIRGSKIPPIPRCIWHSTPAIKSNNGQHNGLRKELEASFKGSSLPWDWYIYLPFNHKYQPNVGEYSLHGSCGLFFVAVNWTIILGHLEDKIENTNSDFCINLFDFLPGSQTELDMGESWFQKNTLEQIVPNVRIEFRIDMVPGSPTTIFYGLVYQPPIF